MAKSLNYLSFPFGETVVTLAEDRGKLGTNQWGEFFSRNFLEPAGKFTCCSGDLERLIVDSGAKRGSVISIVKEKYGASAIWRVKLLGTAPTPITAPKTNGHANGHATPAEVTWANLPAEKYAPSPTDAQLEEKLRESVAMVEAAKAAEHVKPAAPIAGLARCFVEAIDSLILARDYAQTKGIDLRLHMEVTGADLQDLAATLYIAQAKAANVALMNRNDSLRRER